MMTKQEYLLTLVMEECAEVAHRASKAIRFGLTEVQPGQPFTNAERLGLELSDLLETVLMLEMDVSGEMLDTHGASRRIKLLKYLDRAIAEGKVAA